MAASSRPWRSSFSAFFSVSSRSRGKDFSTDRPALEGLIHPSYQTGTAAGTNVGGLPSSRSARRRRDGRAWRIPCADRSRSADRAQCSSIIMRSRVTFATIDAAAIAVHRASPWTTARCGHQQVGDAERVDEHEIGERDERENRALHRAQRRLVDVDGVDFLAVRRAATPQVSAAPVIFSYSSLALERRDGLRIADAGDVALGIEDHRGRDDGAGEASAADLVHAGDAVEPQPPDRVLERSEGADLDHGGGGRLLGRRLLLLASFMRAALPFSSRRKYSLARRTRAVRMTSILSMIGECSGKMRSTPWPNDTLRTVNVARVPPRCMPMTMPSNTWMRSLSPSRTFTCTRTVSPGLIAGRSQRCCVRRYQWHSSRFSFLLYLRFNSSLSVALYLRGSSAASANKSGRRSSVRRSASRRRQRSISP